MKMSSLTKLVRMSMLLCYLFVPATFAEAQDSAVQSPKQMTAQEKEREPKRTEEVSLNQLQARSIIKGWDYFLNNVVSKDPDKPLDPLHYSMRLYRNLNSSDSIDYIIFIDQDGVKTEKIYETRNLPETTDTIVNGDQLKALLVAWANFTKIKTFSHDAADYSFYIYREEDYIYVGIEPKMPTLIWSTIAPDSKQRKSDAAFVYMLDSDFVYKLKYKDYSVVEIGRTG